MQCCVKYNCMAKTMVVWTYMIFIIHGLDDTEMSMKDPNVKVIESCKQKKGNTIRWPK